MLTSNQADMLARLHAGICTPRELAAWLPLRSAEGIARTAASLRDAGLAEEHPGYGWTITGAGRAAMERRP